MRLALRKVMGQRIGFVPADRAAEIEAEKLPMGRRLKAEITAPQNTRFNGLMFAAFSLIANVLNSGPGKRDWNQNSVRRRLLIVTGYADAYTLPSAAAADYGLPAGLPVMAFEPKSMSFDSMDADERHRFWDRAMAYVLSEFGDWTRQHPDWQEIEAIGRDMRTPAREVAA